MSTILFVEDEHAWRAVFGEFLRNEGFTVLEASDITEAVDACREVSEPVDLAIIDVKSGMPLASRLAQRYPCMRRFVYWRFRREGRSSTAAAQIQVLAEAFHDRDAAEINPRPDSSRGGCMRMIHSSLTGHLGRC